MDESSWIFDVGEKDFEERVLRQSKETPVVVDFWATWCPPCRALAPLLHKRVEALGGKVLLAKVNADENQNLAGVYEIEALPTVLAFRDGQIVDEFQGVLSEDYLNDFFNNLQPREVDDWVREAATLEQSDSEKAEELYRRAWTTDPKLDAAGVGLARVLIEQGKLDEAKTLLGDLAPDGELAKEAERLEGRLALRSSAGDESLDALRQHVDASPDDGEARCRLASALADDGKYTEALDELLLAGQKNSELARTTVRETMVQIFHIVGNQSETANTYRQKLSALLF